MTSKNIILLSVFHFLILIAFCGSTSKKIPDHLLKCYSGGGVNVTSPLNVQLLIELFAKIEQNNSNYNIRTISSSILHSLRLDGILRAPEVKESDLVTPFRASSFQYAKYSFLLELLIPGENHIGFLDDLSDTDICTLHFLLSSTIDQWERGDEAHICPLSMTKGDVPKSVFVKDNSYSQPFLNRTTKKVGLSRCPIEKGVIQTSWGDVAAGTLLAAISAALEPQNILLSDVFNAIKDSGDDRDSEIDSGIGLELQEFTNQLSKSVATSQKYISNVLAATLSGDLAEVIVRQGPYVSAGVQNFTFGSWRKWNDSILPRDLYLMQEQPYNFEMTDTEIIAGIDGYIIASHLKDWMSKMQGLRVSQIIEMYYSDYGMAFDRDVRACKRKQNFMKLMANSDMKEQTLHMANFLWMKTGFVYMHSKEIEKLSNQAVSDFEEYWPRLIDSLPGCDEKENTNPMDAFVVTDGTWTKYQSEQFISIISETFDVSKHGSSMALLHGNTGEWASKPTNSLITLFDNIANYTSSWTNRLDFPRVLTSIVQHLENVTDEERQTFKVAGLPRVVIVIAPTTKMSTTEIERSRTLMNSIRSTYMDVYFTYFMKDEEAFKALAVDSRKYSDVLIDHNDIDVREVAEKVRMSVIENVKPKRFMAPPCDLSNSSSIRYQYEDYIKVGEKITYRIHPSYMMYTQLVNVQFQGTDQGEISVCISRKNTEEAAESCKIFSGQSDVSFQIKQPCGGILFCDPIYFIVRARSSTTKCADKDCRYPNQIRYIIRHDGLECLRGDGTEGGAVFHRVNFDCLYLMLVFLYVFNKYVK